MTLRTSERARGFFWSRMPMVIEQDGRAWLADQRFMARRVRDGFLVPLDSRPDAP